MTKTEFDALTQSICDNDLPQLYESVQEQIVSYTLELREKGVSTETQAAALASFASCHAAYGAILIVLSRIYGVEPDPIDPKKFLRLIK